MDARFGDAPACGPDGEVEVRRGDLEAELAVSDHLSPAEMLNTSLTVSW